MVDKLAKIFNGFFFFIALILFLLASWKLIIGLFGWYLPWLPYQSGRLFELSAVFMTFVIAMLLRQIREKLSRN